MNARNDKTHFRRWLLAGCCAVVSSLDAAAANIAMDDGATGIIGVNNTFDGDSGIPHANAGVVGNINDGNLATRVDNHFGGNTDAYSYVGVLWPTLRYDDINTITLTLATFTDGGWFGVSGVGPGAGGNLFGADLVEPLVEVTKDGGQTWSTVLSLSDYFSVMDGHRIGGGVDNPNPTSATVTFSLDPIEGGINGLRLFGENGGFAGADMNGFIGVFELAIEADPPSDTDGDGMPDPWETEFGLSVGTNDAETDSDTDGLSNLAEFSNGTAPNNTDSDGDGLSDGEEVNTHETSPTTTDTDGDGLTDGEEINTHFSDPLVVDTDGDGLGDGDEVNTHASSPTAQDSDADSYPDGLEVAQGTDPADPASYPDNLALLGTAIMGVNDAIDSDAGTPHVSPAGPAPNINDGNPATRADTWFPGNTDIYSYAGVVWDEPTILQIEGLTLTFATFLDGGWFGWSSLDPGDGVPLIVEDLVEPTIQVTTDGGTTWTTVEHTSDYTTVMPGHVIGGGGGPNPTSVSAEFTLTTPVSEINGIRIIGENGGSAGPDANGFLGLFELEVSASLAGDSDGDGLDDEWETTYELVVGTNDAGSDPDDDGLSNLQEFVGGTNPRSADTDGDGLEDGAERTQHNTDPTKADTDGDGLNDAEELNTTGTDPLVADSDGDGLNDGDEVNTHDTDPLVVDSDGDRFPDGTETINGADPTDAASFPSNASIIGTGIIGVNDVIDSDAGTAHANAGVAASIVDGNLETRVDTYNGGDLAPTVSFVGVQWAESLHAPVERLELTHATFFDGGWFGVNASGPGAEGSLSSEYLVEPVVQVSRDEGATWSTVAHSSDYLTALDGHTLPVAFGLPTVPPTVTFTLEEPQADLDAIRIIGTEGGTASGGFIGVFELEVHTSTEGGNGGGDFELIGIVASGAELEISWNSTPGSTYTIEESTNLTDWTTLESGIAAGAGDTTSYSVTPEGTARFFRVVE